MKARDLFPSTKLACGMFDSVEIIRATDPQLHSGTMIPDLVATVDKACRPRDPWDILVRARIHLCGGKESMHSRFPHMDQADVQAWYFLAALQDAAMNEVVLGLENLYA